MLTQKPSLPTRSSMRRTVRIALPNTSSETPSDWSEACKSPTGTNLRVTEKFAVALLLATTLTGCPSNRQAQMTLRGAAVDVPPPMTALAPPAMSTITRLRGPESVLYDAAQDVYFISNLNGGLQTVDNNGFISRVTAETLEIDLKWIEGGAKGVRLDAPKGKIGRASCRERVEMAVVAG